MSEKHSPVYRFFSMLFCKTSIRITFAGMQKNQNFFINIIDPKGLLQNEQKLFKMQRLLFICKKTKRQVRKPAQLCRIKLCNITQYVPTIADSETENNWFYRSIQKSLFRRMTQ